MTERKTSHKRQLVEIPTCLFKQQGYRSSFMDQRARRRRHRWSVCIAGG